MSDGIRSCLQENDDLPTDFTKLLNTNLFKYDTNLIPEAIKLYEDLNIKKDLITVIQPQFETPLPNLKPAVFPPNLREVGNPALDLYDLDEAFASEKIRLAQMTNKCNDEDIEY